jgi:hypothetical protein
MTSNSQMLLQVTHTDETQDTVVCAIQVKNLTDLINQLKTTKHLTNHYLTAKLCGDSQDSEVESSVCSE